MIFLVISLIIFGAAVAVFVMSKKRQQHLQNEIAELEKSLAKSYQEKREFEFSLIEELRQEYKKNEELLEEIAQLQDEKNELQRLKEKEMRARIEVESKISLALQKNHEIEKRIEEWSKLQEANIIESKQSLMEIGQDLYQKIHKSHQAEIEINKNLISQFSQNISQTLMKMVSSNVKKPAVEVANNSSQKTISNISNSAPKLVEKNVANSVAKSIPHKIELVKKCLSDIRALDLFAESDLFFSARIEENRRKNFLCELALIKENSLMIFDFKGCEIFLEYRKMAEKIATPDRVIKPKLEKYFTQLSDKNYLESIVSAIDGKAKQCSEKSIVIVLQSKEDLELLKSIHYYGKARKMNLTVIAADEITNLIL